MSTANYLRGYTYARSEEGRARFADLVADVKAHTTKVEPEPVRVVRPVHSDAYEEMVNLNVPFDAKERAAGWSRD